MWNFLGNCCIHRDNCWRNCVGVELSDMSGLRLIAGYVLPTIVVLLLISRESLTVNEFNVYFPSSISIWLKAALITCYCQEGFIDDCDRYIRIIVEVDTKLIHCHASNVLFLDIMILFYRYDFDNRRQRHHSPLVLGFGVDGVTPGFGWVARNSWTEDFTATVQFRAPVQLDRAGPSAVGGSERQQQQQRGFSLIKVTNYPLEYGY